jgi:hypothetical protein
MAELERLINSWVATAGPTALERVRAISDIREAARVNGLVPDRLRRYLEKLEGEAIDDW